MRLSWVRLRVGEREGETQGSADDGGMGFVGPNSSLSTNAYKPISKLVNQTIWYLIAYRDNAKCVCVCVRERERECVCVLPVPDFDLERVRLFVRTSPQFSILEENRLMRREWRGGKSRGRKGIWRGWKWGKEGSVLDREVAWELRAVWEFFVI